jgi:hypothetical protein
MELMETGWIHVTQVKDWWQGLVNTAMNLLGSITGREFCD